MPTSHPLLFDQLKQRVAHVPVTLLLIGVNLLVFGLMLGHGAGLWHNTNNIQLAWGANFGPATKDGEWWRLGSALFLHFGLLHLTMNMLSLWDGGRLVERMYGWRRFALIYFGSGLSGNLLSLISQGDRAISGGASGAIFGVYGALLVYLWFERHHLHPAEFKWMFWGAAVFSTAMIILGLNVTGIDNAAHIGGLLAGILLGIALAHPIDELRPGAWRRGLAAGVLVSCLALLVVNIPPPRYRWSDEVMARGEISEFLDEDARISARWGDIINRARMEGASFDDLAGTIESQVSSPYAHSFDQLSKLRLSPAAPSASALESLRSYAELRRNASRALVNGLRTNNATQIQQALELANKAPQLAEKKTQPGTH